MPRKGAPKSDKKRSAKGSLPASEVTWPVSRHAVLYGLNRAAMSFWSERYRKTEHAQAFLASRFNPEQGFTSANISEIADRYQIGYAPRREDGGYGFVAHILSKGFPGTKDREDLENALVAAGLAKRSRHGKVIDFFYGRLMFPIALDPFGGAEVRVVAFGGREVPHPKQEEPAEGEEERYVPKWLNTSDSPIFAKRQVLYGWPLAYSHVMESRECIFLEGYLDVIQLREAGFLNVVATLGTSLTPEHLDRLPDRRRKGKNLRIILATDDDKAGRDSAMRSARLIFDVRTTEAQVRIARPRDGLDPDDLVRLRGGDAFREVLDSAMTPVVRVLRDAEEREEPITLLRMVATLRSLRSMISLDEADREADLKDLNQWFLARFGTHIPQEEFSRMLGGS